MKTAPPRVLEIVGPAGAGKTTLCNSLSSRSDYMRFSNFPDVHKVSHAPFFVWNSICLAPLFIAHRHDNKGLSRRQYAWMSILRGWPSRLRMEAGRDDRIIVLDQGPAYLLAELTQFGPAYLREQHYDRFWKEIYYRWAKTLNVIAWLDADDECLLHRIRTREQGHVVKNASDAVASDFLSRFRTAYDHVISNLAAGNASLRIIRFDTGRLRTSDMAELLMSQFGLAFSPQSAHSAAPLQISGEARS